MRSHFSRFFSSLARGALALAIAGCGSTDAVNSKAGAGGSQGGSGSYSGGTSGSGSGDQAGSATTLPSATASCPPWPAAKLLPYVGPFFFGNVSKGPCRVVRTNSGDTPLELLTYDASGLLATMADDAGTWASTVTWEAGLPKTITRTGTGAETVTFLFGPSAVVETHLAQTPATSSQYAYVLTAEGYPSTVAIGSDPSGSGNYAVASYVHFEYKNCRIDKRCRGATAAELQACATFDSYAYDNAGRMISRSTESSIGTVAVSYDYDCSN